MNWSENMGTNSAAEWIPRVDMEFNTEDEAWRFWISYGQRMGFSVRKSYSNRSPLDGKITSQSFVCSNEGFRRKDERRSSRAGRIETRTGCAVRMTIRLIRGTKRYKVTEFISGHNHESKFGAVTEVSGSDTESVRNLEFTREDGKNYLTAKSQGALFYGEAVSLLGYFMQQGLYNPDFMHVELLDAENRIASIFWADAKMLNDYVYFGDVVTFDTTYCTNKEFRPFGVFVGLNYFREAVVFGAALLYDKSVTSFEWLFNTFLETHKGKKPKTIITNQDSAISQAITNVMPETVHGFSTWQIMESATKHLNSELIDAFRACLYEHEKEAEFETVFADLKSKTGGEDTWLASLYNEKKKWAYCFVKNLFCLGMRSTQASENLNKALHNYLRSNMDLIGFFKHFAKVITENREKEIVLVHEIPRIKVKAPILYQTSKLYTPRIFGIFQDEYELSVAALIEGPTENIYTVTICDLDDDNCSDKSYKVFGNPSDDTVACSCYKFESSGLLCSHALKVLDAMNIKLLPEKYILKRWTKEVKNDMVEDTKLIIARRKWELCRKFTEIASRAAGSEELSTMVDSTLDTLGRKVEVTACDLSIIGVDGFDMVPGIENMSKKRPCLEKKRGKKVGERNKSRVQKPQNTNRRKTTSVRKETGGAQSEAPQHLSQV